MALTDEQRRNAATIVSVGRALGATDRDVLIALMTSFQESNLVNVNYGDRDSVGLFQQRDAWAPRAKRLDPAQSARMFFLGGEQGQRGLFDFKTREQMSLTQAAQAVQVSAFPDAYAKHESAARSLLSGLGGSSGGLRPDLPSPSMGLSAPDTNVDPAPVGPIPTTYVDNTVQQTQPDIAPAPEVVAGTPGAAAVTSPGAEAVVAPGAEAAVNPMAVMANSPGALAADRPMGPPPAQPDLDRETFEQLFPDAKGFFTAALNGGIPNGRRKDIVSAAMSWVGTPYLWGGNTRAGADCSGFLKALFADFGIELPRLSADQARSGTRVGMDALQPGDLVAWDNSSRNNGADHISVFVGDGQIIELPRPGLNGRIRKLDAGDADGWGVRLAQLE